MSRKRMFMITLYGFIVLLMILTYFFVQQRYGYEITHSVQPQSQVLPPALP